MAVLSWITGTGQWPVYVENRRVNIIQKMGIASLWKYVPSSENAADILSRGMLAKDLKDCVKWWHGPGFLKNGEDKPQDKNWTFTCQNETSPSQLSSEESLVEIERFSSYDRLIRTIGWVLRFTRNAKATKTLRLSGPLTSTLAAEAGGQGGRLPPQK